MGSPGDYAEDADSDSDGGFDIGAREAENASGNRGDARGALAQKMRPAKGQGKRNTGLMVRAMSRLELLALPKGAASEHALGV